MRQKKIRGHNRLHKQIDSWRLANLSFDLIDYLLSLDDKRCHAKIRVHPWSGITVTNSVTPHPRGKTKQKMLNSLLDIYENWKNQLDKSGQKYYLKIWLFEPRFSQSQVVCAIGENVGFYENTFFNPEDNEILNPAKYGSLKDRLESFTWNHCLDEDHYDNSEVADPEIYRSKREYEEAKNWFNKLLKKPHRTYRYKEPIGDATEAYLFKRGDVWLGGK